MIQYLEGIVKIGRKLPSTLVVKITERKIEYLLEFGSSFAYIDEEGNPQYVDNQPDDTEPTENPMADVIEADYKEIDEQPMPENFA